MEEPNQNPWAAELAQRLPQRVVATDDVMMCILAGDVEKNRGNFIAAQRFYENSRTYANRLEADNNNCTSLIFVLWDLLVYEAIDSRVSTAMNKLIQVQSFSMNDSDILKNRIRTMNTLVKNGLNSENRVLGDINRYDYDVERVSAGNLVSYYLIRGMEGTQTAVLFCEEHVALIHFSTAVYQRYQPEHFREPVFRINPIPVLNRESLPMFCETIRGIPLEDADSSFLVKVLKSRWIADQEKINVIEKYMSNPENHHGHIYALFADTIRRLEVRPPMAEVARVAGQ